MMTDDDTLVRLIVEMTGDDPAASDRAIVELEALCEAGDSAAQRVGATMLWGWFMAPIYPLFLLSRGLDLFQVNLVIKSPCSGRIAGC